MDGKCLQCGVGERKLFKVGKTNLREPIKERFGSWCGIPKPYRVVVLRCACSRKYYNVAASKIGFGRSFTIISKDLSVGGKYELVFAIHCIFLISWKVLSNI